MRQNSLIWIFIPVVIGIPITLYVASAYWQQQFATLPIFGKELVIDGKKNYHTIPGFSLTNQEGKISTGEEWSNKIVVVDFFFTHCAVVCPKMTRSLKKVQASFAENELFVTSFTVDPQRDSASRLKWYADKFEINLGNWQLLTGDKKDIYRIARNGFMLVATDGDGGADDFIHSEKLVLIDTHRRIRGYYNGTNEKEVANFIQDIKKLRHEN
ncbi:MAG: SCO family protein [Chitinophagaceae bacterium]|nr:SCO family protein [Chitinophagaceae bacterium]